jgi:uncharacterized protein YqgV (UPF0045/DUF77 family)
VQRVEFTIEPFVEGHPGPHVTEAIAAVSSMGFQVELGPFGTGCTIDEQHAADVVAAVVKTAFANGATHVNIDVAQVAGSASSSRRGGA